MPTIHLIRHGEVENPKAVIYGRLPGFHLSERGKLQASAAADRLRNATLTSVCASPLERAQETARYIAEPHGLDITTDERLTESASTVEGVGRSLVGLFADPRNWWKYRNPFRPSWGESFGDIRARMLEAIEQAIMSADGGEVAIVSHQTPVLMARLGLARRRVPPWLGLAPCQTGSITSLVLEDGKLLSVSYFAPPVGSPQD